MAANESTVGEGTTVPETKSEMGLIEKKFFRDLDEKKFVLERLTGGGKRDPEAKQFLIDLATGGASAAFTQLFISPSNRLWDSGFRLRRKSMNEIIKSFHAAVQAGGPILRKSEIIRCLPMQTLSFAFKETYRNVLIEGSGQRKDLPTNMAVNFIAGGVAGLTALCFVYPFDYARAQLGIEVERAGYLNKEFGNRMSKIVESKGPMGLYKGFSIFAPAVMIRYACLFGIYDTAKMTLPDKFAVSLPACVFYALIASLAAQAASNRWGRVGQRKLKQLKLKDVFFKGSLSSAYRARYIVDSLVLLVSYEAFGIYLHCEFSGSP